MLLYAIIMFLIAGVFIWLSAAVYRGRTDLIHDYHMTRVTDMAGYARAFGKALIPFPISFVVSGVIGLFGEEGVFAIASVAVLLIGIAVGTTMILIVQKKYNGGLF